MNKLWVRLQHQGHSRDRALREQERKDLRLLIGSTLVRISQLEEITLEMYQSKVLPSLLGEIVSCKDVIAQEYLFDVIIQAFPDEFHLQCLDMYIAAVAKLNPSVNVKQIVISLIDRFSKYAARSLDDKTGETGIPADLELFDVFWEQITELMDNRPEFTIEDISSLLLSSCTLATNCYPERLEYIDCILGLAQNKVLESRKLDPLATKLGDTEESLEKLLLGIVNSYKHDLLILIKLPSGKNSSGNNHGDKVGGYFTELLFLLPYGIRRTVAHMSMEFMIKAAVEKGFMLSSSSGVEFILGELCSIVVHDQIDGNLFGSYASRNPSETSILSENEGPFDWDNAMNEQTMMAKVAHLIDSPGALFLDRMAVCLY